MLIVLMKVEFIWLKKDNCYSRVLNRRRGQNKRVGWQISVRIINGEGAINREGGKKSPKLMNG